MKALPPWEVNGLPGGIRPKDLEAASAFFTVGIRQREERLISVHPDRHGWYFRLSGTDYEENIDRLANLLNYQPMDVEEFRGCRRRYYPAILLPDPTETAPGTTASPIAVCSHTGYLGSAWQDAATELRPEVDHARGQGKYLFTRLRLQEERSDITPVEWEPAVWLPCKPL
jgi:hypothetical protein